MICPAEHGEGKDGIPYVGKGNPPRRGEGGGYWWALTFVQKQGGKDQKKSEEVNCLSSKGSFVQKGKTFQTIPKKEKGKALLRCSLNHEKYWIARLSSSIS